MRFRFHASTLFVVLGIVFSSGLFAQTTTQNGAVNPSMKTTLPEPIYVAGYMIRTSNAKEMGGNGEIGKLWGRFMQQNLAAQIPNRIGQTLIVVYSDYASDEKGEYNYLLGAPVTTVDGLPAGLSFRRIPAVSSPYSPPRRDQSHKFYKPHGSKFGCLLLHNWGASELLWPTTKSTTSVVPTPTTRKLKFTSVFASCNSQQKLSQSQSAYFTEQP